MKNKHIYNLFGTLDKCRPCSLQLLLLLTLLLASTGCKDEVSLPDQPLSAYIQVYMPQAVNGPVSVTLQQSATEQTIIYGANYGGYDYPSEDIPVKFFVRGDLVDSFNVSHGSAYLALPTGTYSLSDTTTVISKGELATSPLKISIDTREGDDEGEGNGDGNEDELSTNKTYLLPVSIRESSIRINSALKTTYFIIQVEN